jgi:hypothetical protein
MCGFFTGCAIVVSRCFELAVEYRPARRSIKLRRSYHMRVGPFVSAGCAPRSGVQCWHQLGREGLPYSLQIVPPGLQFSSSRCDVLMSDKLLPLLLVLMAHHLCTCLKSDRISMLHEANILCFAYSARKSLLQYYNTNQTRP